MQIFFLCVLLLAVLLCSHAFRSKLANSMARSTQYHLLDSAGGDTAVSSIKTKLAADMKAAMIAKEKDKLTAIRSIQAAIKQKEVDDRVVVDDELAIQIMTKLVKQRKESIKSYLDGGRQDLVDVEQFECDIITSYLPAQLTEAEVAQVIAEVIEKVGASSVKDMGKVMAEVKARITGRADMSSVGGIIKAKLGGP